LTFPLQEERMAKLLLASVVVLTLANSGVSVWFSYIGRDFWTALSTKNEAEFYVMMQKFFGALGELTRRLVVMLLWALSRRQKYS
jgi:ABC-type uncharacterized transport system fused permease/ATPase subunit